jgi:hypothetical protein
MLGTIALIVGYVIAVFGGAVFVEWSLGHILADADLEAIEEFRGRGLVEGEKFVGWLERFLVTTFVLAGGHTAVGLVLAAKIVVRYPEFKDTRNHKVAEYVLIETMLSRTWAIVVSVLVLNLTG